MTRRRGEVVDSEFGVPAVATVHPSSILRADEEDRVAEYAAFVEDLRGIPRLLEE